MTLTPYFPRTPGHEDEPALVWPDGSITWRAFEDRVARIANGLAAAGLGPEDRIAVMAGNVPQFVEVIAGCVRAGVMTVPINCHLTVPETAYILSDSGASMAFADAANADTLRQAAGEAGVTNVLAFGDTFEDWRDAQSLVEPANTLSGGPMFYTSGTTGRPKGVWRPTYQISASAAVENWREMASMWGFDGPGNHLVATPIYHAAPFACILFALSHGQTIFVQPKFDAEGFLADVQRYRINTAHIVPTQMIRLLRLEEATKKTYDISSLTQVFHGAAPCPAWVKRGMIDWFGPVIIEYFASSEGAGPVIATSETWLKKPGTVGRCPEEIEITVVDENGLDLPPGEVGTFYFRRIGRPPPTYHNAPEKTAESQLPDGRFTVGDVGWVDDEGYVFLSDRKIDMIISGGANIYPAEVEAAISAHPAVADCAVFGVPDAEWGEQVKAAVQLLPAEDVDEETLIAWCRERIAAYKCPKSVDFLTEMPREASGKLKKRFLRDPYWGAQSERI
jgi:long-chain acyl-CoA synthetase